MAGRTRVEGSWQGMQVVLAGVAAIITGALVLWILDGLETSSVVASLIALAAAVLAAVLAWWVVGRLRRAEKEGPLEGS